jgi:hypothetical protein
MLKTISHFAVCVLSAIGIIQAKGEPNDICLTDRVLVPLTGGVVPPQCGCSPNLFGDSGVGRNIKPNGNPKGPKKAGRSPKQSGQKSPRPKTRWSNRSIQ